MTTEKFTATSSGQFAIGRLERRQLSCQLKSSALDQLICFKGGSS